MTLTRLFVTRSLVKKDFVRLGKWFVQPFDGPDKPLNKSIHLSFAFNYFIHGESSVCASVDVRQHPPIRRLSLHHITTAKGQATPVHVILAPYGLAATLTGVTYAKADQNVARMMKEWNHFYPLDRNRYYCRDVHGGVVEMPAAVEVSVAGVKMVYPTCYVLLTDIDQHAYPTTAASAKTMHTFRLSQEQQQHQSDSEVFNLEHSPFSASNHHLLSDSIAPLPLQSRTDQVWQDSVCYNPEEQQAAAAAASQQQANSNDQNGSANSHIMDYLSQWEFCNPSRLMKKKSRRQSSRERSKDRNRFSSKIPFHRKVDVMDALAWTMGQGMIIGHGGDGADGTGDRLNNSMGPPGSVRGSGSAGDPATMGLSSPASVGPVTPVLTPKAPVGSVRTPGDPNSLLSPPQPASNGPLTPMDSEQKPPRTPKSVSQYSAASPFTNVKSVEVKKVDSVKPPPDEQQQQQQQPQQQQQQQTSAQPLSQQPPVVETHVKQESADVAAIDLSIVPSVPFKRPYLPTKEYEEELDKEDTLSDTVYDHKSLRHWLNHPVKRFRPSEQRNGDPLRPMYRRSSQANVFDGEEETESAETKVGMAQEIKEEPDINGGTIEVGARKGEKVAPTNMDPYEFSDGPDGKKDANGAKVCKQIFTSMFSQTLTTNFLNFTENW